MDCDISFVWQMCKKIFAHLETKCKVRKYKEARGRILNKRKFLQVERLDVRLEDKFLTKEKSPNRSKDWMQCEWSLKDGTPSTKIQRI